MPDIHSPLLVQTFLRQDITENKTIPAALPDQTFTRVVPEHPIHLLEEDERRIYEPSCTGSFMSDTHNR